MVILFPYFLRLRNNNRSPGSSMKSDSFAATWRTCLPNAVTLAHSKIEALMKERSRKALSIFTSQHFPQKETFLSPTLSSFPFARISHVFSEFLVSLRCARMCGGKRAVTDFSPHNAAHRGARVNSCCFDQENTPEAHNLCQPTSPNF